jgi:DNA modification methylase
MTSVKLHHGDCLDVLRSMPDNSVDSIVTDPPYGISFMGKKWDYDVPDVDVWAECLRVLKPGGHLLAFAATRTQHRMAVRIEDAGFELRDMVTFLYDTNETAQALIESLTPEQLKMLDATFGRDSMLAWVYGSGFPKSLNIGMAIDAGQGANPLEFTSWLRTTGITTAQINTATNSKMASHWLTDKTQPAVPTPAQFDMFRHLLPPVPDYIERIIASRDNRKNEREIVGKGCRFDSLDGVEKFGLGNPDGFYDITSPATDLAKKWHGWGTALKPALEPITVARKPFKGTVAANVLANGTGAMNIDGCRVGESVETWPVSRTQYRVSGIQPDGRWPANLIHDGSDEVVALFPDNKSRFFYCAKARKKDRGGGNQHPTVKPTDLMRYLCRLVTPTNGTVLDPFMGSGSTGKAAALEGFNFIGIERESECVEIARARIADAQKKSDAA